VRRVGLTGGIATGKSHVRARFEAHGVPTIDADVLAREVVAPGTPGLAAVRDRFGPGVIDAAGGLDRRALGVIVFADPVARHDLEAIVHPLVRARTEAWFAGLDPARQAWAIADIPLLYETGRDRDFDVVLVAACDPAAQLARLVRRDGLSEAEARRRLAAQWPIAQKVRRADYVIDTNGTVEETDRQVDALLPLLAGRP
jgi:dephospho-CoA kinase